MEISDKFSGTEGVIICHLFPISSVPKNLSHFTFTIFGNGSHIPLTFSHSYFILKLIYKNGTHMPLTFSNTLSIIFLKTRAELNGDEF